MFANTEIEVTHVITIALFPAMDEEQQQKERKKPGCKALKDMIFRMAKSRQNCEVDCRRRMPSCLIPLTSCFLVQIRTVLYIYMIDPFMIFVAFWTGIISFIARCFGCPCAKDFVFSSMECFTAVEELIGIYWDSDWWREYEKVSKEESPQPVVSEIDEEQGISRPSSELSHRSHQSDSPRELEGESQIASEDSRQSSSYSEDSQHFAT